MNLFKTYSSRKMFFVIIILLVWNTIVAAILPDLIIKISGLRTGILIPFVFFGLIGLLMIGQEKILYLLSIIWVVPIVSAGFRPILLSWGMTVWEIILYASFAIAMVTGKFQLKKKLKGWNIGQSSSIAMKGFWFGLLLMTFGSLLSLAVSKTTQFASGPFRYVAIVPLVTFMVSEALLTKRNQIVKLAICLCIGATLLIIFQVLPGLLFTQGRLMINLISPLKDYQVALPNRVGGWCSMVMPIALCFALASRSQIFSIFNSLLYITLGSVMFLTLSRGSIVAGMFSSIFVLYLIYYFLGRKVLHNNIVLIILFVLIAIIFMIYLKPSFFPSFMKSFNMRFGSLESFFSAQNTLAHRIYLWKSSLRLLEGNPLGFGYGTLWLAKGLSEHNLFIMVLNGSGIIGLLGLMIFILSYVLICFQSIRRITDDFLIMIVVASLGGIVTLVILGISMEVLFPTYGEPILILLALGFAANKFSQSVTGSKHSRFPNQKENIDLHGIDNTRMQG